MIHFHGRDRLGEVRGMAVKAEALAPSDCALRDTHDGHARTLEVVHHRTDQLFRHRVTPAHPCSPYHNMMRGSVSLRQRHRGRPARRVVDAAWQEGPAEL